MVNASINFASPRARKARMAHHIASKDVWLVLVGAGLLVAAGGIAMVAAWQVPFGWVIAGLAGPFWMIASYGRNLRDIPPVAGQTIDTVLEPDVLGLLPEQLSPRQLAEVLLHTRGGQFLAGRMEIGRILGSVTSPNGDCQAVWQAAEAIRGQLDRPTINAAMVAAALVRTIPGGSAALLAPLKIDDDDVIDGVRWYNHWADLFIKHQNRRQNGGIGRDWSFGYTPLLNQLGLNVSDYEIYSARPATELPSRQSILTTIMHLLSEGGRRNAALVGSLGAGKTSLIHALARQLLEPSAAVPRELRFRQVIALDPASLIAQAKGRGELEGLVQHLLYEAYNAKNIILFLDDAQLFFEEGTGSVDLSHILLPVLEGGGPQLVLAMDEQRWLRISQANPALSQYLNRVMIPPASQDETFLAMQDRALDMEVQHKVHYNYQALAAAFRLSDRYLSDQVMPGKAVKLLESAGNFAEDQWVTDHSVEQAIEQTQGVKVGSADSAHERETLLNLEQLIHERMINQTRAVRVVSDALRRARAGVRSTKRPIGTFLFLGPTGVGKTELAKSVAAVFFGGEDRLVRLDLNEYVQPNDVSRLIADGATDQHSLAAQIARQPFSVVLLDEIEKAHPNVLGTLLQMLDEGILRDINNREVSFRDAVVIATSNAGAERIREHIEKGQKLEQFEEQFTNELISANVFRPEFLNRFDEIVLFRPLNQTELVQVIDIILKGVNKNLAAQKVSVVVESEAKKLLVDAGYDPRLGARPMRRVVQRVVENIVANQLLAQQVVPGGQITVTAYDVQSMLARGQQ